MRQRVEPLVVDQFAAAVAQPEALRLLVQPPQRLFHTVQVAALLAREEQHLLALHRVRTQIGDVVRVRVQVGVRLLRGELRELAELPQRAERALALPQQALLDVLELLLRHSLGHWRLHHRASQKRGGYRAGDSPRVPRDRG